MGAKAKRAGAGPDEAVSAGRPADAVSMLRRHGVDPPPSRDAIATALMDLFRRTGQDDVFEALVALTREQLMRRVRTRTRFLRERVDDEEMLQDAVINIYRYPDRFDARRPGAFKAWSSTIVDNAVRRHLRRAASGPDVRLRPIELLAQEPDLQHKEPGAQAIEAEACERAGAAFRIILSFYLAAYQGLSERERFVLQMVEVRGMRYAQLAGVLGLRPEALKMVVFRARKRIFGRLSAMLSQHHQPIEPRAVPGCGSRHWQRPRRDPLPAAS